MKEKNRSPHKKDRNLYRSFLYGKAFFGIRMVLHSLRSTFMQRQRERPFIQRGKEAGQKGSGNGMPYAGNGADDGRFRCGSKLGGGGCQIGGKTGVLHTDFDGDGSYNVIPPELWCLHITVQKDKMKDVKKFKKSLLTEAKRDEKSALPP